MDVQYQTSVLGRGHNHRAGPPVVKRRTWLTRLGFVSERVANTGRNREGEHDPEGTSEVGSQGRCEGSSPLRSKPVRYRCLEIPPCGSFPLLTSAHSNFATEPLAIAAQIGIVSERNRVSDAESSHRASNFLECTIASPNSIRGAKWPRFSNSRQFCKGSSTGSRYFSFMRSDRSKVERSAA